MSPPLIEVNGLVKKYGERVAVQGVSFSIEEGETFGMLGPSGAEKTATLSILLTPFPPDEGKATMIGRDIAREAKWVKRLIGSVPFWHDHSIEERLNGNQFDWNGSVLRALKFTTYRQDEKLD